MLEYTKPGAARIYVGKTPDRPSRSQEEIEGILIELAREGQVVVRLKGGDPMIFGRGGEEAQAVARAGILFEIVPGVSSAAAVPAYAGIPLTHRSHASAVAIITGHEDALKGETPIDWEALARGPETLVFLMGVKRIAEITKSLIEAGLPAKTPVAVIARGTLPGQRTVTGTLATISRRVEKAAIEPPAVTVIGEVVRYHEALNWFESKPLFGKRVLVTRPPSQAREFGGWLRMLGAEPVYFPTIRIDPPTSWEGFDRALESIGSFDWMVFTSRNGVEAFSERIRARGVHSRRFAAVKICAIGAKTAESLISAGLWVDFTPPERFESEALAQGMLAIEDFKG
ncbi:MAG: uroporphyrinogen-III C-methyltransferase, partial [Vicinamibacteria bacterium]